VLCEENNNNVKNKTPTP